MLIEGLADFGIDEPGHPSNCLPEFVDPLRRDLAAIAAGDQQAMERFHQATISQVAARVRCMLRTREDAEEIVSDVYLYVWRNAAHYDPSRGSVRAWLSIIARHRAIDRFRVGRSMLSLDDERQRALVASLSVPDSGPATIMASLHWSGAAHDALSLLTPLRRRLLKMSFVGDLTHEEIAAVEGLPLGTVKSHLRRSIGRLRETLQASA